MVTSGGIKNTIKATVKSNKHAVSYLSSNHEDMDTRILLNTLDAAAVEYKRNVGKCRDKDTTVSDIVLYCDFITSGAAILKF